MTFALSLRSVYYSQCLSLLVIARECNDRDNLLSITPYYKIHKAKILHASPTIPIHKNKVLITTHTPPFPALIKVEAVDSRISKLWHTIAPKNIPSLTV